MAAVDKPAISFPIETDASARRRKAHNAAKRGRLAGTVAAKQGGDTALRHDEIYSLKNVIIADERVQVVDPKQLLRHVGARPR